MGRLDEFAFEFRGDRVLPQEPADQSARQGLSNSNSLRDSLKGEEYQLVILVARGLSSVEIANQLGLGMQELDERMAAVQSKVATTGRVREILSRLRATLRENASG